MLRCVRVCFYIQFFFFFFIESKNIQCYVKQLLSIKADFTNMHTYTKHDKHTTEFIFLRNHNDESFCRLAVSGEASFII